MNAPEERSRVRPYAIGAGVGALAVVLVIGLVITAVRAVTGGDSADAPPPAPPPAPPAASTPAESREAETALAMRPMLQLPDAAGQPHALTTETAGPPIVLPPPVRVVGTLVPDSFPATPEGAVAQLAAMTKTGMLGGDPADYARAHDSIAEAGAPPGDRALFAWSMTNFRKGAGLPANGPKPGMSITWEPAAALIKGTVGERYVVVCVLGEFTFGFKGQVANAGSGDCQAMRRVATPDGEQWRIARGARAAQASSAWPGTAEAVAAGYRAIAR
ncbi:hypothetical protein FVA95_28010 [Pseudonocardia sp. EV170527-09]|uniref:hypothetical protein n=1 Tax=Pseudonocardia sp. EV170527-09 TaxID=2603411 RepID=UPI0011F2701C|nr:hypothetical protein [Pseudonocardia sp. EV170527-09]KAA1011255.1 hypothetical protein FVA95_28010 [Pseudonocardia sp. EV170527-09]